MTLKRKELSTRRVENLKSELSTRCVNNLTIGILLCADTDADVAKYSCLHDNDQLYMAKYLTYMPTQEELRREIEQQKMIFAANRILSMLNTYVWTDEHTSVQDCFRLRTWILVKPVVFDATN